MASDPFAAGDHVYKPTFSLSVPQLSYSVFPSSTNHAPLLVITSVGWGVGRTYINNGIVPLFNKYFTVITQTVRGSDQSAPPVTAEGKPDCSQMGAHLMADDIESLREHLGLSTIPILMGHSHGAAIALSYAQRFPNRVEKLILIDGQLIGFDGSANFRRYKRERENLPQYKAAYEMLENPKTGSSEELAGWLECILPAYFNDPAVNFPKFQSHLGGSLPSTWAFMNSSPADKLYAKEVDSHGEAMNIAGLAKIKAKTLCAWGKDDHVCSVDAGNMIVDRIQAAGGQADMHIYKCGHLPWIECEDAFVKRTLEWLSTA